MMIYVLQSGNETKTVTNYVVYMIHHFFAYICNVQLSQLLFSIKKSDKLYSQYNWAQNYCCEYYFKWVNCHKNLCFPTIPGYKSPWTCIKTKSLPVIYTISSLVTVLFLVKHPHIHLRIVFEGILRVKLDAV